MNENIKVLGRIKSGYGVERCRLVVSDGAGKFITADSRSKIEGISDAEVGLTFERVKNLLTFKYFRIDLQEHRKHCEFESCRCYQISDNEVNSEKDSMAMSITIKGAAYCLLGKKVKENDYLKSNNFGEAIPTVVKTNIIATQDGEEGDIIIVKKENK